MLLVSPNRTKDDDDDDEKEERSNRTKQETLAMSMCVEKYQRNNEFKTTREKKKKTHERKKKRKIHQFTDSIFCSSSKEICKSVQMKSEQKTESDREKNRCSFIFVSSTGQSKIVYHHRLLSIGIAFISRSQIIIGSFVSFQSIDRPVIMR